MKSIYILTGCLTASLAQATPNSIQTVRNTVNEWATTEKAITQEALAWQSDKVLLTDMIAVAENRVAHLKSRIEESEELTNAADQERAQLLDHSEAIAEKSKRIQTYVTSIETSLRSLQKQLPEVLQLDLEALYQRIPDETKSNTLGLAERMQNAINIISRIRQFDNKITVSESIKQLPGTQSEAAVQTLWIGLGQAYYLAPNDAGFGIPSADGWQWQSQPELSDAIQASIELVNGSQTTPELITLPISLNQGGIQ